MPKKRTVEKDDKLVKLGKDAFIRLTPVLDILRASIWTARLSDENPVSVLLVAEQESCKTECLKFFRGTSTMHYVSDLTSKGLTPYRSEIEAHKIRHIVLLDLVRLISHNRTVSDRTLQTLAALMEEGESETSDGGGKESWANFPRIGCLMALTPSFFKSKKGKWRSTGFLTRFVPVSFSYSAEAVHEVHLAIANGHRPPMPQPEAIPTFDYQIFCNKVRARQIAAVAQALGEKMKTYGFRYQRVLRALAKAHARINNRGEVSEEDVLQVTEWSRFFTDKEIVL